MKNKKQMVNGIFIMILLVFTIFRFQPVMTGEAVDASVDVLEDQREEISAEESEKDQQEEYSASLVTDRQAGRCTYTIQGVDINQVKTLKLQVMRAVEENMVVVLEQDIVLTAENCVNNTYQGEFMLSDVGSYADYLVFFVIQDKKILAGDCDFSIYSDGTSMTIKGNSYKASRTVKLKFAQTLKNILVPGEENHIALMAWQQGKEEATAKVIDEILPVSGSSITSSVDVTNAGHAYGTWYMKAVLKSSNGDITLAETEYEIAPVQKSLTAKKSNALEAKKSFAVDLRGLRNAYGIQKVTFQIYNSKGKKAASITGEKKNESGRRYYAEVSLKKLNYQLDNYTIKAVLTDSNGKNQTLPVETSIDEQPQGGTLSVTKKGNAACSYQLSKAYIPGNIEKVQFVLYQVQNDKEKKLETYSAKANATKKKFSVSVKQEQIGSYKVKAYGFSSWGEQILLNQQTYQLKEKDMGKNGWYYENYNGKKYKFYYINNVKQTDLTKILGLKESSASHTNNLYIELNRAACTVTIYLYNEETKEYDIPIKTCAVSVGRDIYTTAGTEGLNTNSSYTPLGDYSICSNGVSAKYTLKPMYEPDGSTVYARWCTHIVGNVYFHAIAVGSQSHYALSSYTYNRLGSPASAGCVRMTVADAKWIYDYAPTGTKVKIIKGDSSKPGPLGKSKTIKTQSGIYYDPTDPEVPDSRKKADYKAGKISGYMTKDGEKVGY